MDFPLGVNRFGKVVSWDTLRYRHVLFVDADDLLVTMIEIIRDQHERKAVLLAEEGNWAEEVASRVNLSDTRALWSWATMRTHDRPQAFVVTTSPMAKSLVLPMSVHVLLCTERAFRQEGWGVMRTLRGGTLAKFNGETLKLHAGKPSFPPDRSPALRDSTSAPTPLPFSKLSSGHTLTEAEKDYIRRVYVECGSMNTTCLRVFGAKNTRRMELIHAVIES